MKIPGRFHFGTTDTPTEPPTSTPDVRVETIMRSVTAVPPDTSIANAARVMLDKTVGSVLCVDEKGHLLGIFTDGDLAFKYVGVPFSNHRAPQLLGCWIGDGGVAEVCEKARKRTVGELMSSPVHTVEEGAGLEAVLDVMLERGIKHVVVADGPRPVGIVAHHDFLKLLAECGCGEH